MKNPFHQTNSLANQFEKKRRFPKNSHYAAHDVFEEKLGIYEIKFVTPFCCITIVMVILVYEHTRKTDEAKKHVVNVRYSCVSTALPSFWVYLIFDRCHHRTMTIVTQPTNAVKSRSISSIFSIHIRCG